MDIYHKLTSLALRYLPRKYFLGLRTLFFGSRDKLKPLVRFIYGSFDSNDLKRHLEEKLSQDFEILMVHSSFNSVKSTYQDSPIDFVRTLVDFCGPDRTIAMPAFYFGDEEIGSLKETFAANPHFDLRRTPSQMGLATEVFRRWKGVVQSRNPVYRISALGPLASELTDGHEFADGPAGSGSPFEFMTKHKTLIIGIGKSFDVMTQTHHVEAIMGDKFPNPRIKTEDIHIELIDRNVKTNVTLKSYHMPGRFNIAKLPKLLKNNEMKLWKFHSLSMFSAEADVVTKALVNEALKGNTLYDPPR